MTDYESSRWRDRAFADGYTDYADSMIQERRKLIGLMLSFYAHYMGGRARVDALDLGCGDGTLTLELVKCFDNINPTLLDGSEDMLEKSRARLAGVKDASYITASFQDILKGKCKLPEYDFIFSSLAIHHLDTAEKAGIFDIAHNRLRDGGSFLNIDVVLPPSDALEGWYLAFWKDWIDGRKKEFDLNFDGSEIITRYKGNDDNKPDTLDSQLSALKAAGFNDVDCYYKHGIFVVYGGSK